MRPAPFGPLARFPAASRRCPRRRGAQPIASHKARSLSDPGNHLVVQARRVPRARSPMCVLSERSTRKRMSPTEPQGTHYNAKGPNKVTTTPCSSSTAGVSLPTRSRSVSVPAACGDRFRVSFETAVRSPSAFHAECFTVTEGRRTEASSWLRLSWARVGWAVEVGYSPWSLSAVRGAWFVQVARERRRPTYLLWAHLPVGAGPSSRRRPDPPWQPMRRTPSEPPEHRHP